MRKNFSPLPGFEPATLFLKNRRILHRTEFSIIIDNLSHFCPFRNKHKPDITKLLSSLYRVTLQFRCKFLASSYDRKSCNTSQSYFEIFHHSQTLFSLAKRRENPLRIWKFIIFHIFHAHLISSLLAGRSFCYQVSKSKSRFRNLSPPPPYKNK